VWPFWRPNPFHLGHGQAGDADLGERLADLVELERLDDGADLLFFMVECRRRFR
jgi:hypothetical protein